MERLGYTQKSRMLLECVPGQIVHTDQIRPAPPWPSGLQSARCPAVPGNPAPQVRKHAVFEGKQLFFSKEKQLLACGCMLLEIRATGFGLDCAGRWVRNLKKP